MYNYTRIVEVWDGDQIDMQFPYGIDSVEWLTESQICDVMIDQLTRKYPDCCIEVEMDTNHEVLQ